MEDLLGDFLLLCHFNGDTRLISTMFAYTIIDQGINNFMFELAQPKVRERDANDSWVIFTAFNIGFNVAIHSREMSVWQLLFIADEIRVEFGFVLFEQFHCFMLDHISLVVHFVFSHHWEAAGVLDHHCSL